LILPGRVLAMYGPLRLKKKPAPSSTAVLRAALVAFVDEKTHHAPDPSRILGKAHAEFIQPLSPQNDNATLI